MPGCPYGCESEKHKVNYRFTSIRQFAGRADWRMSRCPGIHRSPIMRSLVIACTFAFASILTVPAYAAFLSGDTLLESCDADEDLPRQQCFYYILGAADALQSEQTRGDPTFCVPEEATADEVYRAAVLFLQAHGEDGDTAAGGMMLAALEEAFPC